MICPECNKEFASLWQWNFDWEHIIKCEECMRQFMKKLTKLPWECLINSKTLKKVEGDDS
jgi:hypothetical protein